MLRKALDWSWELFVSMLLLYLCFLIGEKHRRE